MNSPHYCHSIYLRELSLLYNSFEQLPSNGELERQVIFRTRLEPFVELHLSTTDYFPIRVLAINTTYDVHVIQALQHPHLTPHTCFVPLDFLLRNHFQRNILSRSLRPVLLSTG